MSHNTLENYYTLIFKMLEHKLTITELENMYPYERDVYFHLIKADLEEKKNRN